MSWSPMGDTPNPIFDTNGDPFTGAVLKAYLPGTTTSTSIAINSSGDSLQTSITANASGIWEVSGNEIVPHIDRKHKWAIFANPVDAAANTPAYMGFFDNIEQVSTSGLAGGTVATIAALKALTGQADNDSVTVLGHAVEGSGGGGQFFFDSSSTDTDDNGLVIQPTAGSGRWLRIFDGAINVMWFDAKGDSLTDDLAAFDACEAASNNNRKAMYIPGLAGQNFYKLSDTWLVSVRDNLTIYGDGPASALVSYNESGQEVMEIRACRLAVFRDFSLNGIVGGGDGMVITKKASTDSPSHFCRFSGLVFQFFDGDCLVLQEGQSCTFTDIRCENGISGISIPVLTGGKVRGARQRGIYIKSESTGQTNNASFVNCVINNTYGDGATDYALQVGTVGDVSVGSFSWTGGLIQGGDSNLVYLQCLDGAIKDCHIEASLSAIKYEITMHNCTDTYIEGGHGGGDVLFSGTNVRCGLINRKCNGISISSASRETLIDGCSMQNGGQGPVGKFIDLGTDTKVVRNIGGANASATRYTVGDTITGAAVVWMAITMEEWLGGDSTPSRPHGIIGFDPNALGGITTTRDTGTVRKGSFSLKQVTTTGGGLAYEQGHQVFLNPIDPDMRYFVTAWVNVEVGTASLRLWINGGDSTSDYLCTEIGRWVKLQMTITPDSGDATIALVLGADKSSTVYWDSLSIIAEDFSPTTIKTLMDVSNPQLGGSDSGSGYYIQTHLATGTTAITAFSGQHVGRPFTLIFDANKTVTNNATIMLNGGVNFSATADDTLTLVYDQVDGVFRELGRSVN